MIRLSDVVKEYESGTTALKGISLRIEDGEFVFLVGPSDNELLDQINTILSGIDSDTRAAMWQTAVDNQPQ